MLDTLINKKIHHSRAAMDRLSTNFYFSQLKHETLSVSRFSRG